MKHAWSILLIVAACAGVGAGPAGADKDVPKPAAALKKGQAEAIFAAGCFWCSESDFEKVPGVIEVESGYAGGSSTITPTYSLVGTGLTGHTEAIRVVYDPTRVTYAQLVDHFWKHVDPFDGEGQFCDRGSQYRPAVFPKTPEERQVAGTTRDALAARAGREVAVKLEEPGTFWVAEAYHQDFYKTNPSHYQRYRRGCGRDAKIAEIWQQIGG
jgi:methionine-S-sulfoxide reductase